jgi:type III restriction enzyme
VTQASSFEVAEPILSSPFEEPREHWWIEEGKLPERRRGRRPAGYFYRDPQAPPPEAGGSVRGVWEELRLVNLIRERLAEWRGQGYPGATRTTRELIEYWRREGRRWPLFFCQLEAAETIIFLTEARADLRQGIEVPWEWTPEGVEPFRR